MSNYCECELSVRGKAEDINRFRTNMAGIDWHGEQTILNENALIPYPEEYAKLDRIANDWEKVLEAKLEGKTKEEAKEIREKAWKENPRPQDGYNSGGYEWCIEHWGTKWGFIDPQESVYEDGDRSEVEYDFTSAWSPPTPLIKKMGELYPTLEFELRYFEGGMGFNGFLEIENGVVVSEDCANYYGHRGG